MTINFLPLTNEELVFTKLSRSQWCVNPPLTEAALKKLGPDTLQVIVPTDLTGDDYTQVACAVVKGPKAMLKFEPSGTETIREVDLNILGFFPEASRVNISHFGDLTQLKLLSPELVKLELDFHHTTFKPSMAPLGHFNALRQLSLIKHYEPLAGLRNLASLQSLALSENTLQDLSSLGFLSALKSLQLSQMQIESLATLPNAASLNFLLLSRLPKLVDSEQIAELENLEYLEIDNLAQLAGLPSLKKLTRLRRISINSVRNMADFSTIAEAPNLEELLISDMKHLKAPNVAPFKNHKKLRALRTDNAAVEKYLELPRTGTSRVFDFSQSV